MIHCVSSTGTNRLSRGGKTTQSATHFRWAFLFGTLFLLQYQLGASCIYGQQLQVETERVGNLLWWTTQSESGSPTFLVQRSLNGLDFTTIGTISGVGDAYSGQTYRYWDVDAQALRVWYRIVEMDYEGRGTASPTVVANRITPSNLLLTQMEQTVVQDWFRCTIRSHMMGQGTYTIQDYYGEIITQGAIQIQQGHNQMTVDLGTIPAGRYRITFELGLETEQVWVEKATPDGQRLRTARL